LGIPFVIWKGLLGAVVTMSLGILVRAVLLWFAAQRQILEFQVDRVESQEIAQSLP
jgi:hypothetical protein